MQKDLIEQYGGCLVKRPPLLKRFWRKIWASLFGDIPNVNKSVILERVERLDRTFERLYVAMFTNDAFDIGIGFPDKWLVILKRKTLHTLILWYIWRWIWGEWFGLRRWLFYKILERRVNKNKKFGKEPLREREEKAGEDII